MNGKAQASTTMQTTAVTRPWTQASQTASHAPCDARMAASMSSQADASQEPRDNALSDVYRDTL